MVGEEYGTDSLRNNYDSDFITLLSRLWVHVRVRLHFSLFLTQLLVKLPLLYISLGKEHVDTVCALQREKKKKVISSCPLTPLRDSVKQVESQVFDSEPASHRPPHTPPPSCPPIPSYEFSLWREKAARCAGSGSAARCFPADGMRSRRAGRCGGEEKIYFSHMKVQKGKGPSIIVLGCCPLSMIERFSVHISFKEN